jgi:hypothetical protein
VPFDTIASVLYFVLVESRSTALNIGSNEIRQFRIGRACDSLRTSVKREKKQTSKENVALLRNTIQTTLLAKKKVTATGNEMTGNGI